MPVIDSRVVRGGYTPAVRLVVTFSSGSTLFAKIATNNLTAGWLRQEKHVYDLLTAPFMPSRYGWDDDVEYPILLLEDLSYAFWPPPWTASRIEQVIETTTQVAGRSIAGLPRLADHSGLADGWQNVPTDPRPFLSIGLASQAWLNMSLPTLLAIDSSSALAAMNFCIWICAATTSVLMANEPCSSTGALPASATLVLTSVPGCPVSKQKVARRLSHPSGQRRNRRHPQRLFCVYGRVPDDSWTCPMFGKLSSVN